EAGPRLGPDGREEERIPKREQGPSGEARRLAAARARRAGDGTPKEPLDDRGTLGDLLVHALVDAIEDARHGEEDRRLHDRQVRDQVRDVVVDGDGASHADKAVQLARLAEGVRPWQERERTVVAREDEELVNGIDVGADVA